MHELCVIKMVLRSLTVFWNERLPVSKQLNVAFVIHDVDHFVSAAHGDVRVAVEDTGAAEVLVFIEHFVTAHCDNTNSY